MVYFEGLARHSKSVCNNAHEHISSFTITLENRETFDIKKYYIVLWSPPEVALGSSLRMWLQFCAVLRHCSVVNTESLSEITCSFITFSRYSFMSSSIGWNSDIDIDSISIGLWPW